MIKYSKADYVSLALCMLAYNMNKYCLCALVCVRVCDSGLVYWRPPISYRLCVRLDVLSPEKDFPYRVSNKTRTRSNAALGFPGAFVTNSWNRLPKISREKLG